MIRKKVLGFLFFFSVFLIFCSWIIPAERVPLITGVVKDSVGRILPGVDIFISPDNFNNIVFRARTNQEGKYFLKNISPGTYKIAAAKKGYQTNIKDVNVQDKKSSDMTLKPLANTLEGDWKEKFPARLDWIRRIPKKDILKELEASVVNNNSKDKSKDNNHQSFDETHTMNDVLSLPFSVELKQIISRELNGEESLLANDKTNKTSFSLYGNLGDDGRFRVEALKNKWKESFLNDIQADLFERKSESLGIAGQYDFGEGGRLGFSTFYEKDQLNIRNENFTDAISSYGSQKGWGYSARWEKNIASDIRFDVNLTHAGSEFKGTPKLVEIQENINEMMTVENQIIQAAGKFQANLFDHHKINVGVKTHYHNYSSDSSRIFPFYNRDLYYFTGPEEGGYHISLYGKDSWMVLKAVTISYGVQYYHFFYSEGIQVISPVFEIEYKGKSGSTVKAEISYSINNNFNEGRLYEDVMSNAHRSSGAEKNLSCKAEVEKKLGEGGSIKANISYIPLLLLNADQDSLGMIWGDSFLYMTNGNASSLSAGAFFEKEFSFLNGGVGLNYGTVEGTFSSLLPDDLPLQIFRQGDLDYILAILKGSSKKTNTEISMQLRKVRDQSGHQELANHSAVEYSLISFQFSQKVPVFNAKGVILRAILEYDDTLNGNELNDNIERSLLPYRRASGGFQLTF